MDDAPQLSRSFGRAAADYAAGRPGYPVDALTWLLDAGDPPGPLDVVDVGAGTGKLTQGIAALGHRVRAVEPDPQMLASLREQLPDVPADLGTGERIPLPDAVADRLTYGQAWHWVDPPAASAEAARVLRPSGRLCLIWNIRDESVPWVAELGRIMGGSNAEAMIADDDIVLGPQFAPMERSAFRWTNVLTRGQVVQMAASRSYIITAPREEQERVYAEIRDLLGTEPDDVEGDVVRLPYVTHAFRAARA